MIVLVILAIIWIPLYIWLWRWDDGKSSARDVTDYYDGGEGV